jgi:hypothetical protein
MTQQISHVANPVFKGHQATLTQSPAQLEDHAADILLDSLAAAY